MQVILYIACRIPERRALFCLETPQEKCARALHRRPPPPLDPVWYSLFFSVLFSSRTTTTTMLSAEEPVVAPALDARTEEFLTGGPLSLVHEVSVSVIAHPYLDELADKIRGEPIPWQVRLWTVTAARNKALSAHARACGYARITKEVVFWQPTRLLWFSMWKTRALKKLLPSCLRWKIYIYIYILMHRDAG